MKTLVFGKSGQVATELSRFDGVTCLGRDQGDLTDPAACVALIDQTDADVIVNAAAYTAVDKAESEEDLATQINGHTVRLMAQAAAVRGIPFLHISTDYVFDGTGQAAWLPTDATAPKGAYGRSKLVGEQGVAGAGGSHAILRTSWVFSAHGNNFVKTMLRLAETRDALNVVNDQIGGPTAARDIATALMAMAIKFHTGQGHNGIYHFSGGPDCSWADFATEIFAQADKSVAVTGIPASQYPTPAVRPANSRMDCRDLKTVFGIERPDWVTSLKEVIQDLGVKA